MILSNELNEIKSLPQWVCYSKVQRGDKITKVPKQPATGYNASTNNPQTWGTFEQAAEAVSKYKLDGVGFVLCGGYFGIDLDHVIDPETGEVKQYALDIVEAVNSYTEISPSGTGLHIICKGAIPAGKNRNELLEMYQAETNANGTITGGRYFTVTGNAFREAKPIQERTAAAKAIYTKYLATEEKKSRPVGSSFKPAESDTELLRKAFASAKGSDIRALYSGDTSAYNDDHSRATQALVNHLAYWTNGDASRMDAIFRTSGLYASMKEEKGVKKWDNKHGRNTYGEITIATALRDFTPYSPQAAPQTRGNASKDKLPYEEESAVQSAPDPLQSVSEFEADFIEWLDADISTKIIPSGLAELDKENGGGVPIGLTLLMGESSVGKTALALNMAENMAAAGRTVLFFSTEMPRNVCVARGISRITKTVGYGDIITGKASRANYSAAMAQYFSSVGKNLYFIECFGGSTPAYIEAVASQYDKPVIFVDYLQQLKPNGADVSDERIKMKRVATDLLKLCNEKGLAMVVLSSVSRENYGRRLGIESGKEAGELEYNAACVLGIQYSAAMQKDLSRAEREAEKKKEGGRAVTVTVLKNRLTAGTGEIGYLFKAALNDFRAVIGRAAYEETKNKRI